LETKTHITVKLHHVEPEFFKLLNFEDEITFISNYNTLQKQHFYDSAFYAHLAQKLLFCEKTPKKSWNYSQGINIISTMCELKLDNPQLLRLAAYVLEASNYMHLAMSMYQRILKLRPEEPQSYCDLAHVQAKLGKFGEAFKNLDHVIQQTWDARFCQIEVIALTSMCHIASFIDPLQLTNFDLPKFVQPLLVNPVKVDLRIILSWDTNDVDLELYVKEPNDETCYVYHNLTKNGGTLSRHFTAYGPQEYMIKKAVEGVYSVYVCLATPRQLPLPYIGVRVQIFTEYGVFKAEHEEQDQPKSIFKEKISITQLPTTHYKQLVLVSNIHVQ